MKFKITFRLGQYTIDNTILDSLQGSHTIRLMYEGWSKAIEQAAWGSSTSDRRCHEERST